MTSTAFPPAYGEDMRFEGKRVFVTGAASGIGAATKALFEAEGATVYGVDVSEAVDVHRCDVSDPDSVAAAVGEAAEQMGGIDVVANVAGISKMASLDNVTVEMLNRHLAVNAVGPALVVQAALPHLRASRGNVVTVASISGIQGQPNNSVYCASKGAVRMLMKALSVELANDGIRVNCVCPGFVDTPMTQTLAAELPADTDWGAMAKMSGVLPGAMEPSEIAAAIAYLASDDARGVTGADLVIDHGTLWV